MVDSLRGASSALLGLLILGNTRSELCYGLDSVIRSLIICVKNHNALRLQILPVLCRWVVNVRLITMIFQRLDSGLLKIRVLDRLRARLYSMCLHIDAIRTPTLLLLLRSRDLVTP